MPATLAANAGTALRPAAPASAAGSDAILIVEDDKSVGSLLELLVAPQASRVVLVRTADECLRWFASHAATVKLVVMDCSLPDGHGGTLAHRLRGLRPGLPLLLTSGRRQPGVVQLLAADGPAMFLPKPFRPRDVAEQVRALLAPRAAA
jgi:DNA-binding response OmpR family regulator